LQEEKCLSSCWQRGVTTERSDHGRVRFTADELTHMEDLQTELSQGLLERLDAAEVSLATY